MPAKKFETHKSFAEIVDQYDRFILDQFGVMHNVRSSSRAVCRHHESTKQNNNLAF